MNRVPTFTKCRLCHYKYAYRLLAKNKRTTTGYYCPRCNRGFDDSSKLGGGWFR